jgi:pimeloyl-ACP methyl ester carboxylesterase
LPDELHSIDQPICIVWGAKDKLVPYKTMVELRQILPQSQWKEHALGGHHIMEDQPEWICSEIVNFVDLTTRSQYIDR